MEFLNLFDITIETSLLIILIRVVNRLLKKKLDPNIRYFLWVFVAIRLLVPFRIELSVEMPEQWNTAVEPAHSSQIDETSAEQAALAPFVEFPVQLTTAVTPSQPQMPADVETVSVQTVISLGNVARFIWALGVAVMTGYVLFGNGKVFFSFRKERQRIEVLDYGIPLYAMPGYNCLAGIISPAIYVDTGALASPDIIRNVISHELQHYRVRDNYWQLLRVTCLILQWHNPFMWWAYYASGRDCEMACDARVVRGMTSAERYGYGNSLLAVAESVCRKKQQVALCSTSMGGNKSFMRERVFEIMRYKRKYAVVLVTAIVCLLGVGCFASFHLYASEEEDHNLVQKDNIPIDSVPEDQMEEDNAGEELVLNIQDYYSTNIGDYGNLYYIDEDNVLWGCGHNEYGQLGQGTHDYDYHTEMVKIAENVIHVDYAYDFTIFLTADHKLYGMGAANTGAMLEFEEYSRDTYVNPALYTVDSPKLLMENVVYARRGHGDVVCLLEDGSVWTWGLVWYEGFDWYEGFGWYFVPKPEKILEDAVLITGGWYNHAALLRDGSVWTWGYNYAGSCGYDGDIVISTPVKVAEDAVMVWTGRTEYNVDCIDISEFDEYERKLENTIILKRDGTYWACGVGIGDEEKLLHRYWEVNDYSVVCSSEFIQIASEKDL